MVFLSAPTLERRFDSYPVFRGISGHDPRCLRLDIRFDFPDAAGSAADARDQDLQGGS